MDLQRFRAALPRTMPSWVWRVGGMLSLAAACGLGVLAGAVLAAVHVLGYMSAGWTLVITLAVLGLVVMAGRKLAVAASRQRESAVRTALAAIRAGGA